MIGSAQSAEQAKKPSRNNKKPSLGKYIKKQKYDMNGGRTFSTGTETRTILQCRFLR